MCNKWCSMFFVLYFTIVCQLTKPVDGLKDSLGILQRISQEEWSNEEVPCKDATLAMLEGVRNNTLWASWIWDSMQPPVGTLSGARYHLGNFDQCLKSPWVQPWTSQYCLVEFHLTKESKPYDAEDKDPNGSVGEFVGMETKHRRRLHYYHLGVCLPSVCSPSSVAKISRHLHQLTHLPLADVVVDPSYCQVKEEASSYGVAFYLFWSIMIISASLVTVAYFMEDHLSHLKLKEITDWFSPGKNFEALTRTNVNELSSLNGMRVVCAFIAIIVHYFYYVAAASANNPGDMEKDIDSGVGQFLMQLALVIDTFFVMSGLLHMKGLMVNSEEPVKLLWKRYLRLLGPLCMSVLSLSMLQHWISGPLRPQLLREQTDMCRRNWPLTILMINNYVRNNEICHTVTWYLSCDFQLTIFGTILFCICKKLSRRGAIKVFTTTFIVSMLIPGLLTYWYQLPAGYLYDIEDAADVKLNVVFLKRYMKSYARGSAYLIGMALGYLIHVYKPKDYRKTIYKQLSTLLGILGLALIISILGTGGWLMSRQYSAVAAGLYSMLDRSLWALAVVTIIVAVEYGTFPILGDLLTSKVFTSLSRLSYLGYLFHPMLLYTTFYSRRVSVTYSFFHNLLDGFGYVVVANLIAYALWFFIEAPMSNMTTSFFKNRTRKTSKEEAKSHSSVKHIENETMKVFKNGFQNETTVSGNGTMVTNTANGIKNRTADIGNGTGSQNGTTYIGNGLQKGHVNGLPNVDVNDVQSSHVNDIQNGHVNDVPNNHVNGVQNDHVNGVLNDHVNDVPNNHVNGVQNDHVNGVLNDHVNDVPNNHVNCVQNGLLNDKQHGNVNGLLYVTTGYFENSQLNDIKNKKDN